MGKMLTVKEVAERLRVTPWTVRLWVRGRRLAAVRVGKAYLVEEAEVDRILGRPSEQRPEVAHG